MEAATLARCAGDSSHHREWWHPAYHLQHLWRWGPSYALSQQRWGRNPVEYATWLHSLVGAGVCSLVWGVQVLLTTHG